jgi:ribonuclease P/MRP protein subunit RPP40
MLIIRDRIMHPLERDRLINPIQHGFMPGKSCYSNLRDSREKMTRIVDGGTPVDEIFLDFAEAFDKVPRERLIFLIFIRT